ncbi:MAG: aldehyde dehydrogenase family protein [Gammaproteobacteria bacterium]|nr:aldehyde dehydrogenase family protein [Gammaproteobacteria bacterium]
MQSILQNLNLEQSNPGNWASDGWLGSSSRPIIDSVNPSNGETIASVMCATVDDYEKIISDAEQAFLDWRQRPAPLRGEVVRLITQVLRDNKDALGSLVSLETGKIKAEGDGEVQEMIDIGDFAVGLSRSLYGKVIPSERPRHRMVEQWQPLGPVGIITAFNFPVAVWAWNALIAAVCGDVCIWKPSPKAPLSAIAVQKLVNQVLEAENLPPIFQLFNDHDNQLAQRLVDDNRVPLISFTGSCAVGNQVGQNVAARSGKSLLELGGNNALIVDEFADLELAVPTIVFGAVGTAGQRCTSTRRVFVHQSREKELLSQLKAAYAQVRIGDPLDDSTLMGPLIDESSVKRYQAAIEAIKQTKGEIIFGGEAVGGNGYFVEPTIVKAQNDWNIVQSETFAPILYVIPFGELDDAIAMQNDVPQGLSSSIFTDNIKHAEYFLSAMGSDCGIANVNVGTSGAEIGGAFGGEKETGGGRESGSDAWRAYMRRQTSTINWSDDLPLAQGITFDL